MYLRCPRLVLVFVWGALTGVALCQSPPTGADSLRQYGVGLTKESLVAALKNPNARVRWIAANQLAADKAEDAVPAMVDALAGERDPHAHMNIAFALAQLGDERGFAALKAACDDPDSDGFVRARSTLYLLELHRESCPNAVLDLLQSPSAASDGSRFLALDLVPSFQHAPTETFRKMFDLVVRALDDQDATARQMASMTLGKIGDPSAVPYLQSVLVVEQNGGVRSAMEDALRAIRKKQAEASTKTTSERN